MILAMKMVQVTSEAKASPIMTALTRMSAVRNIDQGDNSRSPAVTDLSGLLPASAAAVASEAAGDAATADGGWAGTCWAAGAAACCADDGDASESNASADIAARVARKGLLFMVCPVR